MAPSVAFFYARPARKFFPIHAAFAPRFSIASQNRGKEVCAAPAGFRRTNLSPPKPPAGEPSRVMATRKKSKTGKRTLIAPAKRGKRYVRRNKAGQFKKEVSMGRSLSADRRRKAKTKVPKGQGDRGETE